ncbi:ZKSCAN1 [Cordylochernes scorpioides]|uniref:ZKSCAN1 n=1 Tax=Cordylochernes scorpioides TaxID=51811 RepID=A0ABY6L549_9ARAC|nr:ZKSCAN1 [Cordylochernes scorpioides]
MWLNVSHNDIAPVRHNFTAQSGLTQNISPQSKPIDYFYLFFTAELLNQIVLQTNKYAEKKFQKKIWIYIQLGSNGKINSLVRGHLSTLEHTPFRFRTGHLKPLKIENNNKIYPTCPKCSLAPADPEHILACIRCTKQDLWERPLLIIKQLEDHELMEFV